MESSNHGLSTYSCQEDTVCQKKSNQRCHSLSKSSSSLASSGQECSQNARNCVHKSLNSIFCMTEYTEDSIQHIQSTEWPPVDDVLNLFPQHMNYSDYAIDHIDEKPQHINHYLAVNASLAPRDEEGTESIVVSKTSENLSLLGHPGKPGFDIQIGDHLETRATGVQKSYSDFFCDGRNPISGSTIAKNRCNTTYSALCSSSSFSGSCSDGASSTTNDSGTVCSPSTIQNNLTELIYSAKDESMLQGNLNNSTIQHNITIYAVPGTYEHGVLGPRNSGNGFPHNRHVCSQPYYNIPGVMSCDNISETRHSPPPMIIHNNCTQHCCRSHDSVMKTDDTIAAYCHAIPISSVQFSSGLDCSHCESDLGQPPVQFYSFLPPPLVFPKLVSSVSESGLDTKKLIRCSRLAFPSSPMAIDNLQLKHSSTQGTSDLLIKSPEILTDNLQTEDPGAKMKDTWTMTSMNCFCAGQKLPLDFRDAEVQTVIIVENKSVSTSPCLHHSGHSHMFPDVGLTLNLQCPKSPVREVRWDEEGMTWEVYGAAVDPEVLGLAIQKHLEIQIEQNLQSEHSGDNSMNPLTKEKRRSLRNVMHSLRQSNCCVRTNSTSE